jgi:flavodoxin
MKCCIVYFGQTGNTKRVAERVQAGVVEAAGNCDPLELRYTDPKQLYKYDLIGLGSPVHRWEPLNVGKFVKEMWSLGASTLCNGGAS